MSENDKLLRDFLKLKPIRLSNDPSFQFLWNDWLVLIGAYSDVTQTYFMRIGLDSANRKDLTISEDAFWEAREYFFEDPDVEGFKNDILKATRKLKLDNLDED